MIILAKSWLVVMNRATISQLKAMTAITRRKIATRILIRMMIVQANNFLATVITYHFIMELATNITKRAKLRGLKLRKKKPSNKTCEWRTSISFWAFITSVYCRILTNTLKMGFPCFRSLLMTAVRNHRSIRT